MKPVEIDWVEVVTILIFSFLYVLFTGWLIYSVINGILFHNLSILLKIGAVVITLAIVLAVWDYVKTEVRYVIGVLKCAIF